MKKEEPHISYFGLQFIATGEDTNGRYFMCKTTVPAGDPGPPVHIHSREDESFYLQKGTLKFFVNRKEILLSEGEFLNIEKGEKHTWINDSDHDAELIIIFTPAGIENMFVELEADLENIKEIGQKYGTEFHL